MIIRKYRPADDVDIKNLYRICFSGPPWNLEMGVQEVEERWQDHSSRSSFTCFVAEEGGRLIGASWYDIVSPDMLAIERGRELVDFITPLYPQIPLVWIRETIVDPVSQGMGIASRLKEQVVRHLRVSLSPVVLLTRMRDDNIKIVHLNKKLGFERTGIKVASKVIPGLFHEYWYLCLG